MKKEKGKLAFTLLIIIGIVITMSIVVVLIKNQTNSGINFPQFNSVANINSPKEKKIVDKVMTWGECLELYSGTYFYEYPNANPRQDIIKDHKVRVLITEYPKGVECKNGFYNYGITCNVFDTKTKENLASVGFYKDKKNKY